MSDGVARASEIDKIANELQEIKAPAQPTKFSSVVDAMTGQVAASSENL